MDELELVCSTIVAITEKQAPRGATYEQMKDFASEKAFLISQEIHLRLAPTLRARLAQKISLEAQGSSGNAGDAVTSSHAASDDTVAVWPV